MVMKGTAHGTRGGSAVRPSPVFLALVAAAVLCGLIAWRYGADPSRPAQIAVFGFVLAAWIVSLCLHEFGHAYLAYRSGDRSVGAKGYLTLNPLKYTHVALSIVLPVMFVIMWRDRPARRRRVHRAAAGSAAGCGTA